MERTCFSPCTCGVHFYFFSRWHCWIQDGDRDIHSVMDSHTANELKKILKTKKIVVKNWKDYFPYPVLALTHHSICCQQSGQGVVVGFGFGAKISTVLCMVCSNIIEKIKRSKWEKKGMKVGTFRYLFKISTRLPKVLTWITYTGNELLVSC